MASLEKSLPFAVDYRYSRRRRTVSIEVREARVVVRAPVAIDKSWLADFVARKQQWVLAKLAEQARKHALRPSFSYRSGTRLPYLDGELELRVQTGARVSVCQQGEQLWVTLSQRRRKPQQQQVAEAVWQWYRAQALALLSEKTHALCRQMGLTCRGVKVRLTRSKWGHCTSAGIIQYNWQILLAPESVVDYLVAHEVCHLRHHNHSRAFWQLVASVCPSYQHQRKWLRDQGFRLLLPAA